MDIEKRPGWDWLVKYNMFDEPGEMLVFGAMTIEQAIDDARGSLAPPPGVVDWDYEILSVERLAL